MLTLILNTYISANTEKGKKPNTLTPLFYKEDTGKSKLTLKATIPYERAKEVYKIKRKDYTPEEIAIINKRELQKMKSMN